MRWQRHRLRRTSEAVFHEQAQQGHARVGKRFVQRPSITIHSRGTLRFYWGTETQPQDPDLTPDGTTHPAYRGQCYAVFKDWLLGQNRTNVSNVEIQARRYPSVSWLSTSSALELDANPIAVVAEWLESPRFGLGLPVSRINTELLDATAFTLLNEGLGISPVVTAAASFRQLLAQVLDHIDGYQNGSPTTVIGPPTTGTRVLGESWRDALGGDFICTAAGTPGTWKQTRPAAVTADPASGTIPTGYLILNVTAGIIKRHAGGYVWESPSSPTVREMLTASRTYYVATTGSDSNDGLSAGAPFLTIQKAIDTAASLDTVIYAVTVQVADGTYEQSLYAKTMVGSGGVTIQGNSGNPSAVIIRGQASKSTVQASQGSALALKDVKLEGNASGYALVTATGGGIIDLYTVVLGTVASGQPHITANRTGVVRCYGNYSITAGAMAHFHLWANGIIDCRGRTVTVTGTPAFTTGFAVAAEASVLMCNSSTFSGSATGKRYEATANAVIQTAGGGASFFPGDVAGTTATGGQYV